LTPGAPWRIRLSDELVARFSETAGEGFVTMHEATRKLGISRQTVLQRVKRGELEVAHVTKNLDQGDNPTIRTLRPNLMNQGAI
jgi:hypothetical protein